MSPWWSEQEEGGRIQEEGEDSTFEWQPQVFLEAVEGNQCEEALLVGVERAEEGKRQEFHWEELAQHSMEEEASWLVPLVQPWDEEQQEEDQAQEQDWYEEREHVEKRYWQKPEGKELSVVQQEQHPSSIAINQSHQ